MADAPLTGNYPELPEPQGSKMLSFATAGDIPGWILYVKQYARAAIDADRAARSDPPSPPAAGPRPVTPYTCPECHALWLHWPAEQSGFGMDTLNCRSTTHCDYCEKGGVEQLRRLERVPATLSAPAAGAVADLVKAAQAFVLEPGSIKKKLELEALAWGPLAAAPTPAAQGDAEDADCWRRVVDRLDDPTIDVAAMVRTLNAARLAALAQKEGK